GGVPDDRRRNQRQDQRRELEIAASREKSRRNQQRIPRQKEADEETGLGKDDRNDPIEADDANELGDVVDVGEEAVNQIHQMWSSACARSSFRSSTSSMPTDTRT